MTFIVKTERNNDQIIYNGYIFEKKRVTRAIQEWRCIVRTCKVRGYSEFEYTEKLDSFYINNVVHNHESNNDLILKKIYIQLMKNQLTSTLNSPRLIVSKILEGVDVNVIKAIGDFDLIYRNLRNLKQKLINPLPHIFPTLKIGRALSDTYTHLPFYKYGPDNYQGYAEYDDVVIFFSENNIQNLKNSNMWSMDGTFEVVPNPYKQLLTISYLKNHHIFPVIFCILKGKSKCVYQNMFKILKKMIHGFVPSNVKIDFESGLIAAIKEEFPSANISGCQFHLNQAIMRKINEHGLMTLYKTCYNFKIFSRSLGALAYVKIDQLKNTFYELSNHQNFPIALKMIYNYFFNNFIGEDLNARYNPSIWLCNYLLNGDFPRKNNAIEGWHSIFKATFNGARYSLPLLIFKLKQEEDFTRIKTVRMDLGHSFNRNKKYLEIERNLISFLLRNESNNYGSEFVFELINYNFY